MIIEEKEFKKIQENMDLQKKAAVDYLLNNKGISLIFKSNEIRSTKQELVGNINYQALIINEIFRRQYAQKLLNELREKVNHHKRNVEILLQKFLKVKENASNRALNMQNYVSDKRKTFVIDLHKEEIHSIYAHQQDYVINDFIEKNIPLNDKLYDFYSMGENIIEEYFWNYTKKLSKALEFKNKSIDDILKNYSDDKKHEIARKLLSKSNALWSYDMKGFRIGDSIHKGFVIGLPTEDSSFKEAFSGLINAENTYFVTTGLHNKIVCYRMETAVPVFAVNDMSGYEKEIKISNICHHIDFNWLRKMERENFSIWPEEKEDHSLEAWVFGFVYNFIKYENGKYQLYSKIKGKPLKKYWVELSNYRDDAFAEFVKNEYVPEIIEMVENKKKQMGDDASKELINDVVENYLEKYSQNNLSMDELDKREYEKIADLLSKEIDFTAKELSKVS